MNHTRLAHFKTNEIFFYSLLVSIRVKDDNQVVKRVK